MVRMTRMKCLRIMNKAKMIKTNKTMINRTHKWWILSRMENGAKTELVSRILQ